MRWDEYERRAEWLLEREIWEYEKKHQSFHYCFTMLFAYLDNFIFEIKRIFK